MKGCATTDGEILLLSDRLIGEKIHRIESGAHWENLEDEAEIREHGLRIIVLKIDGNCKFPDICTVIFRFQFEQGVAPCDKAAGTAPVYAVYARHVFIVRVVHLREGQGKSIAAVHVDVPEPSDKVRSRSLCDGNK